VCDLKSEKIHGYLRANWLFLLHFEFSLPPHQYFGAYYEKNCYPWILVNVFPDKKGKIICI